MKIDVYVDNDRDRKSEAEIPDKNGNVRFWNIYQLENIPSEVLQTMAVKKNATFPLTMVRGQAVLSGRLPTAEDFRELSEGKPLSSIESEKGETESIDRFANDRRMHISMFVKNIKNSVRFYTVLFDRQPVTYQEGYAKFDVDEPPVNFTLVEHPRGANPEKTGNIKGHFGIQLKSLAAVQSAARRYREAGLIVEEEESTACCYAVQEKAWVADPDHNMWEIYVVTESAADAGCDAGCVCKACDGMEASYSSSSLQKI